MEFVLDANVLVAGFLRSAVTRELLLDGRLRLWTPEHSLTETERVLTTPRLRRRLGEVSAQDVRTLLGRLTSRTQVVLASTYAHRLPEAHRLAPHSEDAPYLALALHLNLPLWSNDAGLKTQQAVEVFTTPELLEQLRSRAE